MLQNHFYGILKTILYGYLLVMISLYQMKEK